MQDRRTVQEIINQMNVLNENNSNSMEYITSIDLMLTSDNNSTSKDTVLSNKFERVKKAMEELNNLSKDFINTLKGDIN